MTTGKLFHYFSPRTVMYFQYYFYFIYYFEIIFTLCKAQGPHKVEDYRIRGRFGDIKKRKSCCRVPQFVHPKGTWHLRMRRKPLTGNVRPFFNLENKYQILILSQKIKRKIYTVLLCTILFAKDNICHSLKSIFLVFRFHIRISWICKTHIMAPNQYLVSISCLHYIVILRHRKQVILLLFFHTRLRILIQYEFFIGCNFYKYYY